MEPTSELELKIGEKEALPSSLLGVEPWIIRSLPDNLKVAFLNQYKKAIQVSHHPDLYQNPGQKRVHERFFQVTISYIELLLENKMEREFAFDNLYSRPNSEVRLKNQIETLERDIVGLQKEISENQRKYQSWRELQSLNSELRDYEQFALLNYSDKKILNPQFSGKINLYHANFYLSPVHLLPKQVIQKPKNFLEYDNSCSKLFRDNFLTKIQKKGKKEIDARHTLEFENGKANFKDIEVRIVGGLSYIGLKGYLIQNVQSLSPANDIAISERYFEALINLDGKATMGQTFSPGSFAYEAHNRLSPFIRPNMLCMLEEGKTRGRRVYYNMQFIDSIE